MNGRIKHGMIWIGVTAAGLGIGHFVASHTARAAAKTQAAASRQQHRISAQAPRPGSLAPASIAEVASQAYPTSRREPPESGAGAKGPPPRVEVAKLSRKALEALADRCAPGQPASILASIVRVESGGDPLKIGVNGNVHRVFRPASKQDAVALATQLVSSDQSVDLGLAQINSRNLAWLGLSVEDAFDPCRNIASAAVIIERGYGAALKTSPPDRSLLQTAYSLYNTGDPSRGLLNGYVSKVEAARQR